MRKTLLAAALVLFLPALAHAQAWSTISLLTSADGAQQLVLRDNDGTISGRISVTNLLPDNPVTGVSRTGSTLTFTFEDGSTQDVTLPSTGKYHSGPDARPGARHGRRAGRHAPAVQLQRLLERSLHPEQLAPGDRSAELDVDRAAGVADAPRHRAGLVDHPKRHAHPDREGCGARRGFSSARITQHSKSSTRDRTATRPTGRSCRPSTAGGRTSGIRRGRSPLGPDCRMSPLRLWCAATPAPDATTNTKWLALGSAPTAVVIASSNTSIPASANGNTYVHTGSSNITYTLPAASGGTAVANRMGSRHHQPGRWRPDNRRQRVRYRRRFRHAGDHGQRALRPGAEDRQYGVGDHRRHEGRNRIQHAPG